MMAVQGSLVPAVLYIRHLAGSDGQARLTLRGEVCSMRARTCTHARMPALALMHACKGEHITHIVALVREPWLRVMTQVI